MSGATLMLDGLTLPAPAQLVADCRSVGAGAFATYAWRRAADGSPLPIYVTPAHLDACRIAGIRLAAIVVPGSSPSPTDVGASLDAAQQLGWDPRWDLISVDLETYSLPPGWWATSWIAAARARGWFTGRYGQVTALDQYALADWSWIAAWRTVLGGDIFPVPPLWTVGGALQYSHDDVVPGGIGSYDASVIDPALFSGGDMTPDEMQARLDAIATGAGQTGFGPTIQAILSTQQQTYNLLAGEGTDLKAARDTLTALKAEVDALQTSGTAGLTPVYARLDALSKHLGVGTA